MQMRALVLLVVVVVASGVVLFGCAKPEPPTVTPKEVRVVAVGSQGLELLLKMEALNPNKITLSCQSVTAKAKLDGKWDLGTVTIAKPIVLPPNNVPTMIDVPLTMPWSDVKTLGAIASANRPIPYAVDGTVSIGGERLNVDVPFHMEGTITREQITNAALKGLPAIPGLTAP